MLQREENGTKGPEVYTSAMTLWSSDSVLTFETKYLYVISLTLPAVLLVKYF
jgi:hypothetical protein